MKTMFLALSMSLLTVFVQGSCRERNGGNGVVSGTGSPVSQSRSVTAYDKLSVTAPVTVEVTGGAAWSFEISGCPNQTELVKSRVSEGRLEIYVEKGNVRFPEKQPVKVTVTMPGMLSEVKIAGLSAVGVHKPVEAADFSVKAEDMARFTADDIRVETFTASVEDMSGITVSGKAGAMNLKVTDMSKARLQGLQVRDARCEVSDMSGAEVNVSGKLEGNVTDMSKMVYYGDPEKFGVDVSDMSSLKKGK